MPFYPRKKRGARRGTARARTVKVSKPVRAAVKQIMKKQMETKTINCPSVSGGGTNSVYVPYGALSGVQYLCQDVFRCPQGTNDSTAIGSLNRIGDKVQAIGFLMDYSFSIPNYYPIAATSFFLPYVKLRITVFQQAFGTPLLSTPLLYDSNFLPTNTSTLQPINWDEGYVKKVLYDKVVVIRNNLSTQAPGSATTPNMAISGNMLHFKKYIKFPHTVKYTDNNTSTPDSTTMPIYIAIAAEYDDSNTGVIPSGTKILFSTGYTRAWFKDA